MKQHSCIACGNACVGRQCRICYTKPKLRPPKKSIWQHEWAYIYELREPDTQQTRYVGCSEHPAIRLRLHFHNAWKEHSKKDLWLRELIRLGKYPILYVVKKVPYNQRLDEEQKHIRSLLDAQVDLLNMVVRGRYHPTRKPKHIQPLLLLDGEQGKQIVA